MSDKVLHIPTGILLTKFNPDSNKNVHNEFYLQETDSLLENINELYSLDSETLYDAFTICQKATLTILYSNNMFPGNLQTYNECLRWLQKHTSIDEFERIQ